MDFEAYYRKTYAAWLGKIIGIRLGAPVENWTHKQIMETYGKLDHYPVDYGVFAADDDSNGPLFFVRSLDYNPNKSISSEEMGNYVLNILSEGHGFFWWGGDGIATEHTAYLRLKEGMKAPLSGVWQTNGKVMAEQIGGQIFSDCWGYVSMGDAQLAADLAEKMASVTHDLDGIEGGRFVAACIALAYTHDTCEQIIEEALRFIKPDSHYAKLVREITAIYKAGKTADECLKYIQEVHGYDQYEGVCHILPNTAIMIMAMLYGENDFSKTMTMLCTAGWDTDCTCGNVGSIMGALAGIEGIDAKWITPINDLILSSSLLGSENIDTISHTALRFAAYGAKLHQIEIPEKYQAELDSSRQLFRFYLPYGTHAFKSESTRYFESQCIVDGSALKCVLNNAFPNTVGKVLQKSYYRSCDIYDARYQPSFSPKVYPGETIRFTLSNPQELPLSVSVYALGRKQKTQSAFVPLVKERKDYTFRIEPSDDLILEYGLELRVEERILHSSFLIHEAAVDRNFDVLIDFKNEVNEDYGLDYGELRFIEVSQCTTLRNRAKIDNGSLVVADDFVLFGDALGSIGKMELELELHGTVQICYDVQGWMHYQAIELKADTMNLIEKDNVEKTVSAKKLKKDTNDCKFLLKLDRNNGLIIVDGESYRVAMKAVTGSGCAGLYVPAGSSCIIHSCQLVSTNSQ